jgi:hypothetical protein
VTSVAHETPRLARTPLPSWRAALVSALFGWFFASCFFGLLAIIALELGFLGRTSGSGLRGWPYPEAGWASVLANSVVWFLIFALTALLIRGFLADRSGRPISSAMVFPVLLVTGFAPAVPRGLLSLPWPVALLAAAALLRLVSGFGPAPLPKRTTAKLIAAGAAFLAIPAFHATTHPLWPGNAFFEEKPEKVILSLRNAGLATLELKSLSLRMPTVPAAPAELRSVRLSEEPPWEATQGFPFRLEPRSESYVQLNLRPLGCGVGQARASATFTYEVLGRTRSETLLVDIPRRAC